MRGGACYGDLAAPSVAGGSCGNDVLWWLLELAHALHQEPTVVPTPGHKDDGPVTVYVVPIPLKGGLTGYMFVFAWHFAMLHALKQDPPTFHRETRKTLGSAAAQSVVEEEKVPRPVKRPDDLRKEADRLVATAEDLLGGRLDQAGVGDSVHTLHGFVRHGLEIGDGVYHQPDIFADRLRASHRDQGRQIRSIRRTVLWPFLLRLREVHAHALALQSDAVATECVWSRLTQRLLGQIVLLLLTYERDTPARDAAEDFPWLLRMTDALFTDAIGVYTGSAITFSDRDGDSMAYPARRMMGLSLETALDRMHREINVDPRMAPVDPMWQRPSSWRVVTAVARTPLRDPPFDATPLLTSHGQLGQPLGPRNTIQWEKVAYHIPRLERAHVVRSGLIDCLVGRNAERILLPSATGTSALLYLPRDEETKTGAARILYDISQRECDDMVPGRDVDGDDDDDDDDGRLDMEFSDSDEDDEKKNATRDRALTNVRGRRAVRAMRQQNMASMDRLVMEDSAPGMAVIDMARAFPPVSKLRKDIPSMVFPTFLGLMVGRRHLFAPRVKRQPSILLDPRMVRRSFAEFQYLSGARSRVPVRQRQLMDAYVNARLNGSGAPSMVTLLPGLAHTAQLRLLMTETDLYADRVQQVLYNGHSHAFAIFVGICMLGCMPINGFNLVLVGKGGAGKSTTAKHVASYYVAVPFDPSATGSSLKAHHHTAGETDTVSMRDDEKIPWLNGGAGDESEEVAQLKQATTRQVSSYKMSAVLEDKTKKGSRVTTLRKYRCTNTFWLFLSNETSPVVKSKALENRLVILWAAPFQTGKEKMQQPKKRLQEMFTRAADDTIVGHAFWRALHLTVQIMGYQGAALQGWEDSEGFRGPVGVGMKAVLARFAGPGVSDRDHLRAYFNDRVEDRIACELHTLSRMREAALYLGDRLAGRGSSPHTFEGPLRMRRRPRTRWDTFLDGPLPDDDDSKVDHVIDWRIKDHLSPRDRLWTLFHRPPMPVSVRSFAQADLIPVDAARRIEAQWLASHPDVKMPEMAFDDAEDNVLRAQRAGQLWEDFVARMAIAPPRRAPRPAEPSPQRDIETSFAATLSAGDAAHVISQAVCHFNLFRDVQLTDWVLPWLRRHMGVMNAEHDSVSSVLDFFTAVQQNAFHCQGEGSWHLRDNIVRQYVLIPITGQALTVRRTARPLPRVGDELLAGMTDDELALDDEKSDAILGGPIRSPPAVRRATSAPTLDRMFRHQQQQQQQASSSADGYVARIVEATKVKWFQDTRVQRSNDDQAASRLRRACEVMLRGREGDEVSMLFTVLQPLLGKQVEVLDEMGEVTSGGGLCTALMLVGNPHDPTPEYLLIDRATMTGGSLGRTPTAAVNEFLRAWNAPNGNYSLYGNVKPSGERPNMMRYRHFDPDRRVKVRDPHTDEVFLMPGSLDAWHAYWRLRYVLDTSNQARIDAGHPPLWEPLAQQWVVWVRARACAPHLRDVGMRSEWIHYTRRLRESYTMLLPDAPGTRWVKQVVEGLWRQVEGRLPDTAADKGVLRALLAEDASQAGAAGWSRIRTQGAAVQRDLDEPPPRNREAHRKRRQANRTMYRAALKREVHVARASVSAAQLVQLEMGKVKKALTTVRAAVTREKKRRLAEAKGEAGEPDEAVEEAVVPEQVRAAMEFEESMRVSNQGGGGNDYDSEAEALAQMVADNALGDTWVP